MKKETDKTLYSYDVFDTILYRMVPSSTDIFAVMEKDPAVNQLWGGREESFYGARKKTEFWLRRKRHEEISITDIYQEMRKKYFLTEEETGFLMDAEFRTEQACSFLNQKILWEIREKIAAGKNVVLISDMYWSGRKIQKLLSSKDRLFEKIKVYASCDFHVTKKDGRLYGIVAKKEGVSYQNWQHTGDNRNSDFIAAKKLGIHARLQPKPLTYQFEKKLGSCPAEEKLVYGVISRVRQGTESEAFRLGASIAGPMVYQYVSWMIDRAFEKKIRTLYFVLRDGYILKKAADILIAKRKCPIRTEYIFGSRVAWRFPELTIEKLKNLSVWDQSNWIFRDPAIAYVPYERLGFAKYELTRIMGTEFTNRRLESFADFKESLDEALENADFCKTLQDNIRRAGDNLQTYLKKCVDPEENFAFADSNSTGQTQNDLEDFIKARHMKTGRLKFFYHTFLGNGSPDDETQFVFKKASEKDERFPEALLRAPYNPCYGYTDNGDPCFFEGEGSVWDSSFDYTDYLRGIIAFTETFEDAKNDGALYFDLDGYVDILYQVTNFRIRSEDVTEQIGKIPFYPDLYGNENGEFYPRLSIKSLIRPFRELIYFPRGSYYRTGALWPVVYRMLYGAVKIRRGLAHGTS